MSTFRLVAAAAILSLTGSPALAAADVTVPIASTAVSDSMIVGAATRSLYRLVVTSGASAGFVLIFAQATVPANGASPATMRACRPVAANSTLEFNYAAAPARLSTGVVAVFSTTGCFTITKSATAFFEAHAKP